MCWSFGVEVSQHLQRDRNLAHKHFREENLTDFQNCMVVGDEYPEQVVKWDARCLVLRSPSTSVEIKHGVLLAAPPQQPNTDSSVIAPLNKMLEALLCLFPGAGDRCRLLLHYRLFYSTLFILCERLASSSAVPRTLGQDGCDLL